MSHWCLWHKRENKYTQVLYTNHTYPSSVVSNVRVKGNTHHDVFTQNTKIYFKKTYFSLPFHTPLICSVCTMSSLVTNGVKATSMFAPSVLLNECDDPFM